MTQFMRWYSQAGTPEVTRQRRVTMPRARPTRSTCKQSLAPTPGQPVKEPMVIPLALGLVGKDGRDLPLALANGKAVERGVLVLDRAGRRPFEFTGIAERPVLSINRGFSAPIKLVTDLDADDLAFLAAHDSDPFNRWQALQTISTRLLIDNVAALARRQAAAQRRQTDGGAGRHSRRRRSWSRLSSRWRWCRRAKATSPARSASDIDPDAIFRARTRLARRDRRAAGAGACRRSMSAWPCPGRYSPDAASAGRRALRNVALDLLAATGASPTRSRAPRGNTTPPTT